MSERIVWVPVMYGVMVRSEGDAEAAENAARQLVMDLLEENWDETFEYEGNILDFIGFEWLNGMFSDLVQEAQPNDNEEETQEGSSEAG